MPTRSLLCLMMTALVSAADPSAPVPVSLDDQGRVFEGIGALSAGASSRLLLDYPEAQRTAILDYLFTPKFGASLHQLKVEIGGEINSTDGTEPAHARTREEMVNPKAEYYQRGYEWWLMVEAKKRNPAIMLDVLQWGAPPWIGEEEVKHVDPARRLHGARDFTTDPEGKNVIRKELGDREFRFFSQDNADFIAAFIQGAKTYHGLDIDFCGIWNEITYEAAWIKRLRRTLDQKGLSTVKIVAADLYTPNRWEIAKDLAADPELNRAVHAIGAHYPFFHSTPEALASGKSLYASEDISSKGDWESTKKFAQSFNRNYIQGRMTKTVFWSLVAAYYDYLDFSSCGPMRATTPWSGHYEIQPAIWAVAHTTQFTQPGWRYLDRACAITANQVSHVALVSPEGKDLSIIIESVGAKQPQTLSFAIDSRLAGKPVALWRTTKDAQFQRLSDLALVNGTISLTVEPGAIYSLTTTTGQRKGEAVVPAATPFPLPYADDFEARKPGQLPAYFADQEGAFEIAKRPDGQGQCLFQAVVAKGIPWLRGFLQPYSVIGPADLADYRVSCAARIVAKGSVAIGGRVTRSKAELVTGYWLEVGSDQRWTLCAYDLVPIDPKKPQHEKLVKRVLAEGLTPAAADAWHTLSLSFLGAKITAQLNGVDLATVEDKAFATGAAGLMSGWNQCYFDDFSLRAAATK